MTTRTTAVLAALAVSLLGCSSSERTSPGTVTGGTMIILPVADATDIFPTFVNDVTGRLVQDQVFDRLAEISPDLTTIGDKSFTPRLAKSWTWSPDSLSIAFSLDPRARWHDGAPVRASDVRYSAMISTNPKTGSVIASLLTNLDSVSVRDSLTPVAWFKKHTPEQFYDLVYQLLIVPEHVYGRVPPESLHTSDATHKLVGSGRFRFVRWEPGTRLELIADTANYRGRPKLDRLVIVPTVTPAAATQLLTGQADFQEGYPLDQVNKLDSSKVAQSVSAPNLGYVYMGMNQRDPKTKGPHPIFGDVRVRRAISMGVDRVAMLRNVFGSGGRLSHGPFPAAAGYADTALRVPPFDTGAAKALLDSAGWKVAAGGMRAKGGRPLRFTLTVPTTSVPRQRYAVLLQEQLRRLGVQVDIDPLDGKASMDHMARADFDAFLFSFGTDPGISGAEQAWGTAGIPPNGQNWLRYSNSQADALFDSATTSRDGGKVKVYASRAFQAILDDAPAIFLYDLVQVEAINRRITIAPMRADEWWANLADWSIPPDKRIDRDRIGLATAKP